MAEILIVGGGVAGLSAGIYAAMSGHRVVVCEKNALPGGCLCGWRRGEYTIDNCIHWLTGTNPATKTYRMWNDLGVLGDISIERRESLYTCELDGRRLSLWRDLDRLEAEMLSLSPEDSDETRKLCRAVRGLQFVFGIGGKGRDESAHVLQKAALIPILAPYFRQNAGELAARFSHPLIREFLAGFLTENFGAIALLSVFAHFTAGNADLPRGASAQAARRMADRFAALGGELMLNAEVDRVNISFGSARSVTLANGRVLGADHVVIAADPAAVFGKIVDCAPPPSLAKRYARGDLFRFSCFQCAFSIPTEALTFSGDLIISPDEERKKELGAKRLVFREFSNEASFAPPGETVLQAMIFCDENACRQFIELRKNRKEYAAVKARLCAAVASEITRRFDCKESEICLLDSWTPATYNRYVGSQIGSFMSFAFGGGVVPGMISGRVEGVDNLLLATQWLQAPGGLPIAAESGRRAAFAIDAAEARKRASAGRRKPIPNFLPERG